jgi:hypothetical protein
MTQAPTSLHLVKLGSALLIVAAAAATGCEPPPDTSPAVSITSPINDQTFPADKPIDVRFTISGIDASGPTMIPFALSPGSMKQFGKGKVRAFIDRSNFIAQAVSVPSDAAPFKVPDDINYKASDYLHTPGKHTITLQLYYNGDQDTPETKVDPQREGTVSIIIQ